MDSGSSVLRQINQEIEGFKSKNIHVVPGLTFNQYELIQKILFYYNSKFSTGEIDEDGDRKYFYNINKNPCKVFSKAIDFDTKNIRMLTVGGGDPLKTWFMERDLKFWMRDKQFGKVLNRIFKELPIFGSVVLKIVEGYPYFVDLRNFVIQQTAKSLDSSNYIIEVHTLSVPEFRKIAKQMKWKESDIKKVIEEFHKMKGQSYIKLYERYGEVEKDGDYTYRRVFHADVGVDEYDQYQGLVVPHPGVTLSSEEWDGHPYWEFHTDKMPGRWLGVGVVESLFEPQIRQNELCNLQSKASYWLSLHIFQTRDPAFNRNLNGDVRNGETLTVDSEVTEVVISDRNLAHFAQEHQKWSSNRDELTFSYDGVQGNRLPAGTTAAESNNSLAQTLSYFELIQEDVALDVKEMIYEVIVPQFEKENTAEHTLRLVGKDLDEYITMVKNELVLKELIKQAVKSLDGDPFPTESDKEVIEIAVTQAIKQGKEKILTVPKDFYKGVKYDIDIDITGESIDTRVRYATKFALLQAATADPTLLSPEEKKALVMSMSEDGGVNPNDFFSSSVDVPEGRNEGRAGGGVSAPQLGMKIPGQTSQTL